MDDDQGWFGALCVCVHAYTVLHCAVAIDASGPLTVNVSAPSTGPSANVLFSPMPSTTRTTSTDTSASAGLVPWFYYITCYILRTFFSLQDSCLICCDQSAYFGIGKCNHAMCFTCIARLRVLCNDTTCPSCRADISAVCSLVCDPNDCKITSFFRSLDQVVVTEGLPTRFDTISTSGLTPNKHGVIFNSYLARESESGYVFRVVSLSILTFRIAFRV